MATKYDKLTWRAEQGGRWRKRYKGRDYYFARLPGESKESSYGRCLKAWEQKKAEIDEAAGAVDYRRGLAVLIERTKARLTELAADDTPENRVRWSHQRQLLLTLDDWLRNGVNPFDNTDDMDNPPDKFLPWGSADYDEPAPWWSPPVVASSQENSIGGCVQRYLAEAETNANRQKLSKGRVEVLRVGLASFRKHVGESRPAASLTSGDLDSFRKALEQKIDAGELRPHSARDRLQAVKQFVRWAWELELMPLPRLLQSRKFAIALPATKIETFTDVEVQRILAASSDSTRLYLLLMLNCGMTQIDVAELLQSEVDWKKGRITRKRSKTRKGANGDNVPSITYPLWPEVFRLLKEHRSTHPELALTNANGEPLKVESLIGGRLTKKDNIRSAFNRVIRKLAASKTKPLKIDKPLKLLRKTAATKLGAHPEYAKFAQYFLGHAPTTVADKHYVRPDEQQFDAAVRWLGTQIVTGLAAGD